MKNSDLITYGLIGLGAYLLLRPNQVQTQQPFYPGQTYYQLPPNPNTNAAAWQQWVATIVSIFGNVATLWQPGGPFYNTNITPGDIQAFQQTGYIDPGLA